MTVKLTNVTSFWQLLADAPKGKVTSLFLLMILASLTDGIGLLLLVPLLSVIDGGSSLNPFIEHLLHVLTLLGIPPTMNGLLSVFVLLVACRSAIQYGREQMGAKLQHELVDQLRLKCFRALLEAEWRWLVGRRQSDHANLLMSDVSRVGMGLNFGISLMASSITIVAYLFAAFALSWSMTSLALLTGSIGFLLLSGQRNKAFSLGYNQTRASRSLQANVQESLAGIKLAKILVNEQRHLDFFTHVTHTLRQQQLAFGASTSLSKAFFQFGGAALLACYLYLGLSIWHIPVPELLILILIFSRLIPQFMAGQQQFHHLLHALPALQETQLLLTDCQNFAEPPHTESKEKWPITNSISFKQVYVSYKEREKPILHNLTLSFQARTTTAIIGASGAGKSTLADVLMGLLTPDSGELLVDGRPITGSARHQWRKNVAYVPQEVFLFHDSIRQNLMWGYADATEQELRFALQQAAAEFVFQLPQGLDTIVGDGGMRLSGGERQRIALARALLKKPSLLILDEATSALDYTNEARIRRAIEQLHGDLTVVLIGHRLPTLEHADQVIVLAEGRLVSQGSWQDVKAENTQAFCLSRESSH
jgi:ATP-binding cassette subfamily C protein